MSVNQFPDATSMDYAFIGGLAYGTTVLVAPLVTEMVKICRGVNIPMFMGTIFITGAFISASFANKIWELYLSQGLLVGIGQSTTESPCKYPICRQII